MKFFHKLAALLMLAPLLTFAVPATGYAAWNPFGQVDCSGSASTSAVCTDKGANRNPLTGSDGLIVKIVNLVALFAGIAAVVIIILAGLRMVTSNGSAEDVAGARRSLIYTAVGLVVLVISRTLVVFILNRI